ncbi:MAG: Rieske 2Fe-2S domain-containing protein [Burkholderiales bacterium]|nr:Rieske 2Fe-2S domain-containing protein [Burkholderiales bacterium]
MKAPLCKLADIPGSGAARIDFFGREALVYKVGGQPRTVVNTCTHLGGPLELNNGQLVCAWHGARFDAASGDVVSGPRGTCAHALVVPTRVEDGVLTYVYGE